MVRVGLLPRRQLPEADPDPLGPQLATDPRPARPEAFPLARLVEVRLVDVGHSDRLRGRATYRGYRRPFQDWLGSVELLPPSGASR